MRVTSQLTLGEDELHETFVRAAGPGGQNVNKVATAVQLRFDVGHSPSLPEAVRQRLLTLAQNRISAEGVLLIEARRFRTQEQNRADARRRLAALIVQAATPPKPRRPTRPSRASKERQAETKRRRSATKRLRRSVSNVED